MAASRRSQAVAAGANENTLRRRPMERARRFAARSGARCSKNSRVLRASGMGAPRRRDADPRCLRVGRARRWILAIRNGRDADRREIIRRERLCPGQEDGRAAGQRRSLADRSDGKARPVKQDGLSSKRKRGATHRAPSRSRQRLRFELRQIVIADADIVQPLRLIILNEVVFDPRLARMLENPLEVD